MAVDHVVAKTSDLKDGEMKQVQAGELSLVLARVDGEFHAIGSKCTHYGAPLAKGHLSGHRVVCPWHCACFDVRTGDVEETPALSAVSHFDVRVEGDDVIVTVPEGAKGRRVMDMAEKDLDADGRTFAIVGAGAAGSAAAEGLRQQGFQGRIVMITREDHGPYDRPDLSKDFLAQKEHEFSPELRSEKFYANRGIELLKGREVKRLDPSAKTIEFADGETLTYDKCLVATGGRPRRLNIEGADLENVFTLRSLDDAERMHAASEDAERAVVIGASFIAMETAASLTKRGLKVTVAAPEKTPFESIFGKAVGQMFREDHEANGVEFRLGQKVVRMSGETKVDGVYLGTRELLQADLVLMGIGVEPVTDFIDGVERNDDGSLSVDDHMQVQGVEDLYAAGDIAAFPDWRNGNPIRIEHWRLAQQLGRLAAANMIGNETRYEGVPFFWSNQFKANIRYVGYVRDWDDIIFHGDPADKKFLAYYIKDGRVAAIAGCGMNEKICELIELMRLNRLPSVDQLKTEAAQLVGQGT